MRQIPQKMLHEALAHLRACHPEEGCGVIVHGRGGWWFRPMANAVNRFHEADPSTFPRDSRSAYLFDPKEQREVWRKAEEGGLEIVAIVHSHCDQDASFSQMDEEMAMAGEDVPLHPGVEYLIFAIWRDGRVEVRGHRWSDGAWCMRQVPLDPPPTG